jgi:hypothetical protein
MLTEAARELGVEDQIVVRELAELLLASVMTRAEAIGAERIKLGFDRERCHA